MPWSVGHLVSEPHLVSLHENEYLLSHTVYCSAELLTELSESEDFRRGLLWIMLQVEYNGLEIRDFIGSFDVTSNNALPAGHEVLLLLADGRQLNWLQPGRDTLSLMNDAVNMAETLGWQVEMESNREPEKW